MKLHTFRAYASNNNHFTTLLALFGFTFLMILWNQQQAYRELKEKYDRVNEKLNEHQSFFPFGKHNNSRATKSPSGSSLNNLFIHVPILPLDENNKLILPPEVKRIWIDIGAHKEAMNTLPSIKNSSDLALIAIEPMFDMWGHLTMVRHHDRVFTIPAAVSSKDGITTFRRATTDMCSSLKEVDPEAYKYKWPGGCAGTFFSFNVPTIRLETILEMIPLELMYIYHPNIYNLYRDFVKVDAQGADFDVMLSAGKSLYRIKSFCVEVQTEPLYRDAKQENDFTEYFQKRGFKMERKMFQNKHELNMLFVNTQYEMPVGLPLNKLFNNNTKSKSPYAKMTLHQTKIDTKPFNPYNPYVDFEKKQNSEENEEENVIRRVVK